jgi:hypothetical protein
MKTTRTFKGSYYFVAIAVAIILGEVIAWEVANAYGFRAHPLTVAFLCIGLVAAFASVLYDDARVE